MSSCISICFFCVKTCGFCERLAPSQGGPVPHCCPSVKAKVHESRIAALRGAQRGEEVGARA